MTALEATVEVFMTAYKALPRAARAGFLARLIEDREVREDLMDIAAIEKRKSEKARPFIDYLATHRARQLCPLARRTGRHGGVSPARGQLSRDLRHR